MGILLTTDAFMGVPPAVRILKHSKDTEEQTHEEVLLVNDAHPGRITRAMWGRLNKTFVTSCEDGLVRKFDASTGKLLNPVTLHDKTSKLLDADPFEVLKPYQCDRPLNTATISPI